MLDWYSKAVLSVIAGALTVIAAHDLLLIRKAQAQVGGPVHVILDSVQTYAYQFATVPVRVQQ